MPHLLIRFFTVPDARAARHSLIIGTTIIGLAMGAVLLIIATAAVALVGSDPGLRDPAGGIIGGTNMINMHLSRMLGDRKSVVEGKSVSVRVDLGGRRIITKK